MSIADKKQHNRIAILEALRDAGETVGSEQIAASLLSRGLDLSERTVRLYLKRFDDEGFTVNVPKHGRSLTAHGLRELDVSTALTRVGYMSARIDRMTYRMTFDLATRSGSVVVNMSLVRLEDLRLRLDSFLKVFEKGFAMGTLVGLLQPGEALEDMVVPEGYLGLCTVCSVTLNGVLLKHGVPVRSLFSGLLELKDGQPRRFAEIIAYEGSSIDPLEMFIRGGLTDYLGAIRNGNGRIGAGFREIPAESHGRVVALAETLGRIGLGAFLEIGLPGRSVLNIPVREGCCGVVVIGGLNPMAVFEESGIRIQSRALSGTLDFLEMFPFHELPSRLPKN